MAANRKMKMRTVSEKRLGARPGTSRRSAVEEFLALSDAQKEAVYQSVNREFSPDELSPLTPAERKIWEKMRRSLKEQHRQRRGRPKRGLGAKVISLSMERGLLERADAYATRIGLSRAQLVAKGLERVLPRATRIKRTA